jgi:hypothetical protein
LVIDDLSAARDNILADLLKDVLKLAALGGFSSETRCRAID